MTIAPLHCPRCGRNLSHSLMHVLCRQGLDLEPPRYCVTCGRRMKVQVLPAGWRAECVEHGASTSESS